MAEVAFSGEIGLRSEIGQKRLGKRITTRNLRRHCAASCLPRPSALLLFFAPLRVLCQTTGHLHFIHLTINLPQARSARPAPVASGHEATSSPGTPLVISHVVTQSPAFPSSTTKLALPATPIAWCRRVPAPAEATPRCPPLPSRQPPAWVGTTTRTPGACLKQAWTG